nr:hypothetical protein DVH24_029009 [Ipomoea batatas]
MGSKSPPLRAEVTGRSWQPRQPPRHAILSGETPDQPFDSWFLGIPNSETYARSVQTPTAPETSQQSPIIHASQPSMDNTPTTEHSDEQAAIDDASDINESSFAFPSLIQTGRETRQGWLAMAGKVAGGKGDLVGLRIKFCKCTEKVSEQSGVYVGGWNSGVCQPICSIHGVLPKGRLKLHDKDKKKEVKHNF